MSKKKIKKWCDFTQNRGYVLMAISREKENPELSSSDEIVHRRVLVSEDDVDHCYDDLLALIDQYDYTFRLYLTVNARSLIKAFYNFEKKLQEMSRQLYYADDGVIDRLGRLGSEWKSEVHKPEVKISEYFHYDLDDINDSELSRFLAEMRNHTDIATYVETPNGYHVVVEPFNYKQFESPIEVDEMSTDGMLFVEVI